jgi:sugar phosphate permease
MVSQKNSPTHSFLGWAICGLAAIFYLYEYSLRIMPTVMTNSLMATYKTDATHLGNLTAFYYYAYAPMQLFVGIFLDKFSVRKIITFACLLCALGSFLFACSENLSVAELGRLLVGFGSAFAFVAVLKLASIWLPPNRFALIVGLTTALGNIGGIVGVTLLSQVVVHYGWKNTTYGSAIVGIVLALLLYLIIRNKQDDTNEPPLRKKEVTSAATHSKEIYQALVTILKKPTIWIIGFIGCILYAPSTTFAELWGLPFMHHVYHISKTHAGYCISLMLLGFTVGAPIAGYLSDRIEKRKPILIASSVLTLISSTFIIFFPHSMSLYALYATLFFFGFSYGAEILIFAVACDVAPPYLAATAAATVNMFTMLSGIIFQPLVGYILDTHWDGTMANGIRVYSTQAYQYGLACLPIAIAIGLVLCLIIRETCQRD